MLPMTSTSSSSLLSCHFHSIAFTERGDSVDSEYVIERVITARFVWSLQLHQWTFGIPIVTHSITEAYMKTKVDRMD